MIRQQFAAVACLLLVTAVPGLTHAEDEKIPATAKVQVRVILDGKPAGDVRVFLYNETTTFIGTQLNAEGKGIIDRVFVGEYVVTVEGEGIPVKYSQPVASQLRVKIAAGENEFTFELRSK